ncbi:MAG: hypothetical protein M1826_007016 [Phylliscum demangeonii]|nr:MAG: hypothetical protein M1826_007016 [Phylliscum demangeonii]
MPPSHRLRVFDEELGKRNDDHKPGSRHALRSSWPPWSISARFRRRRVLALALFTLSVYFLFRAACFLRSGTANHRSASHSSFRDILSVGHAGLPPDAPRPADGTLRCPSHYYDGPIEFTRLGLTLPVAAKNGGSKFGSSNVLFAAANLKSVAALVPLACEMARWRRSDVQFVVMGRDDVSMEEIMKINGVSSQCTVTWHGLGYMHNLLHPQVVLIDDSKQEDPSFQEALAGKAGSLSIPVIRLPGDALETLMWITRLDAWNKATIDVLIRAPEGSSGSLMRLLQSLKHASIPFSPPPRIIVELPPTIDLPTQEYLKHFEFGNSVNQVTLRHRLRAAVSPEEQALQVLESFFPRTPSHSNLLVLSPQGELSPLFFHYVKYALLEYRHSSYGTKSHNHLLGLSFGLPSRGINSSEIPSVNSTAFLWPVPDDRAAVYFGEKWVELHDFVRRRLEAQQTLQKPAITRRLGAKRSYWMEYVLELATLRGYQMLYSLLDASNGIVTIHSELDSAADVDGVASAKDGDDETASWGSSVAAGAYLSGSSKAETGLTSHRSLLSLLPAEGDLPGLEDIPVFTESGQRGALMDQKATQLASAFKRDVGGCDVDSRARKRKDLSAADLFCLDDDNDNDGDEEENDEAEAASSNADEPTKPQRKVAV